MFVGGGDEDAGCWYLIRQTIAADTGDTRGYTGHPANVAQNDTNIDLWRIKKVCVLHNLIYVRCLLMFEFTISLSKHR